MDCRIIRIDDQTWRLEEEGVRFFLLTGSRSALLIDSGMRVHNAKKLAEGLTALPLSLLNTHADRDHIGSNAEFDAVYMSPAELVNYPLAKKASDIIPIRDGSSIDLGGRRLEIIEIPRCWMWSGACSFPAIRFRTAVFFCSDPCAISPLSITA